MIIVIKHTECTEVMFALFHNFLGHTSVNFRCQISLLESIYHFTQSMLSGGIDGDNEVL